MKKNYILLLISLHAYSANYVPDERLGFGDSVISEKEIPIVENLKSCAEYYICLKDPKEFEKFQQLLKMLDRINESYGIEDWQIEARRNEFLSNPDKVSEACKKVSFYTFDDINKAWELNDYIKDDMPTVCSSVIDRFKNGDFYKAQINLEQSTLNNYIQLSGKVLLKILESFIQKLT
jgi:hypothetical protein